MNIKDIHVNPHNPRFIRDVRYQKLKESIQRFPKMMKLRPIIVDNNGMILGGNMRYLAMIDLGYKEIPEGWVVKASELTEEEQRKFKIIDNIPFGDWDYDILANEWDFEELKDWGMEFPEMESTIGAEEDEFDIDKAVKEVGKPISEEGDIWQLGKHRLMCGDSRKKEDVERLMDGKKADMVFTDPPYGVYTGDWSNSVRGVSANHKYNDEIDDYKKFTSDWLNNIKLNEYNTIYIWTNGKQVKHILNATYENGFKLDIFIIWVKDRPVFSRLDYLPQHEICLYGWKGKHKFYGKNRKNIVEYSKPQKSELHPTMKPVKICIDFIEDGSRNNYVIYDGFGGSGSTLIACEQLKRICYMMEIDPIYCDVIIKRWEQYTNKKAVKISGEAKVQKPKDSNK